MRDFNKFGPFGCGRVKAALRFSLSVSSAALMLGGMGGGCCSFAERRRRQFVFCPIVWRSRSAAAIPAGGLPVRTDICPRGRLTCRCFRVDGYCPEGILLS